MRSMRSLAVSGAAIVFTGIVFVIPFLFILLQAVKNPQEARSLSFSWRLILAPLEVVDYVVVHELVHTVFRNHSKQFWARVGTVMPDSPKDRRWLRENGRQLLV